MKNDAEILKEVQNILDWDSAIDATHITVEVKNGVVNSTLFIQLIFFYLKGNLGTKVGGSYEKRVICKA